MTKALKMLAGASTALVLSVAAAFAAPLGPLGSSSAPVADEGLITKVHGFHRSCEPGGRGWHRHGGGGAWIPCGPGYYQGPPVVVAPPPPIYRQPPQYYRPRNDARCAVVYNNCIANFPRGTAPYYSCMQSQRC